MKNIKLNTSTNNVVSFSNLKYGFRLSHFTADLLTVGAKGIYWYILENIGHIALGTVR